ncbi:unnamed protein product [Gongylonema pulchrum]|uniref:SHSP domain-containing protein n=1 Tax=Gongylonema pulchrum TaxID=637853 RepID=A0A183D365_9BILA|nr:unnamed protein product [Gongylonema pulchrum]
MKPGFQWSQILFLATFAITSTISHPLSKLPSKFFGRYTLESSANLDAYLIARGFISLLFSFFFSHCVSQCLKSSLKRRYKWLTRRLILVASVTKIIRKATSGLPRRYDMETLTWKKNVHYRDFALGVPFLSDHLEDGLFNVTINVSEDGVVMTENVVRIGDPEDDETFEYTREGDYLTMVGLRPQEPFLPSSS